jgi:4-amino-4-deoxy-L-arabinose transferase-like glycosyltransferase
VLFAGTAYFVHYGAHVMADILSAGFAAAAVALWIRARATRSFVRYAACGVAVACAALAKYPLVTLPVVFAGAELWHVVRARRIERHPILGLAIVGVTGALVFLGTFTGLLWRVGIPVALGLQQTLAQFRPRDSRRARWGHESWSDYGPMLSAMMSAPTLVLAAFGSPSRPRARGRDGPFLAWLVAVGGRSSSSSPTPRRAISSRRCRRSCTSPCAASRPSSGSGGRAGRPYRDPSAWRTSSSRPSSSRAA